ncbi:MAG: DNA-binding response regulator [Desulfovibrio sp.]|nr:MAG: DNA-binding response regulator [Desulfovibrio sp.]
MQQTLSVLIVDDHPLTREGLISVLKRDPKLTLAGEAGSGEECRKKMASLQPDMVLMDVTLPDVNGIDLARELLGRTPKLKVVMVSMHSKMEYVAQAFEAGAKGYVVKGSPAERILEGLRAAARDEPYLDSAISPDIVMRLLGQDSAKEKPGAGVDNLSERETEVLVLLAQGLSTKEAADKLFISPKTVEGHRAKIMAKYDLHTPVDLVRLALRLELIDLNG